MQRLKRYSILCMIIFFCVGCDQATKSVAQEHLLGEPPIVLADNFVRFEYTENPAAFMSFGSNLSEETRFWLFTVLSTLLVIGLLLFAVRESVQAPYPILIALALFIGGGIGNLIDRIFNDGHVVDFVSIGYGPLRTGIFNIADMALMAGLALMVFFGHQLYQNEEAREEQAI